MNYIDTDIVAEVRHNRELLLEQHGGIDGLHRYMEVRFNSCSQFGFKQIKFSAMPSLSQRQQGGR